MIKRKQMNGRQLWILGFFCFVVLDILLQIATGGGATKFLLENVFLKRTSRRRLLPPAVDTSKFARNFRKCQLEMFLYHRLRKRDFHGDSGSNAFRTAFLKSVKASYQHRNGTVLLVGSQASLKLQMMQEMFPAMSTNYDVFELNGEAGKKARNPEEKKVSIILSAFSETVMADGSVPFVAESGENVVQFRGLDDYYNNGNPPKTIFLFELDDVVHFDAVLEYAPNILRRSEFVLFQCNSYKRRSLYRAQRILAQFGLLTFKVSSSQLILVTGKYYAAEYERKHQWEYCVAMNPDRAMSKVLLQTFNQDLRNSCEL